MIKTPSHWGVYVWCSRTGIGSDTLNLYFLVLPRMSYVNKTRLGLTHSYSIHEGGRVAI